MLPILLKGSSQDTGFRECVLLSTSSLDQISELIYFVHHTKKNPVPEKAQTEDGEM